MPRLVESVCLDPDLARLVEEAGIDLYWLKPAEPKQLLGLLKKFRDVIVWDSDREANEDRVRADSL